MRYNPKIKIFLDSSSINEVQKFKKIINISGVTTNPSIMKNEGVLNYYDHCIKMRSKIHDIPLSFEILSDNREKIIDQAIKLSNIGKNIYVKIPIVNSLGKSNLAIIKKLLSENIKINVTAILNKNQISSLAKIVKNKDDVIVSIFAGRIADTLRDPLEYIKYAKIKFKNKNNSKILWASCREVLNIQQANSSNCDIITVSPSLLSKIKMYKMSLKNLSISTSLMFYNDAKKANFKI